MLLLQAYAETRGVEPQRALVGAAIDLMFVVTPVASELTRLPASNAHPGCTAGMSFATVRGYSALPASSASDRVLLERFGEIVAAAARLSPDLPGGDAVATNMSEVAARLVSGLGTTSALIGSTAPASGAAAPASAPSLSRPRRPFAGSAMALVPPASAQQTLALELTRSRTQLERARAALSGAKAERLAIESDPYSLPTTAPGSSQPRPRPSSVTHAPPTLHTTSSTRKASF